MRDTCFLFLDNPNGGVEDIQWLSKSCPWIKGVYVNVRDYDFRQWEKIVRPRCLSYGLYCGPWARTTVGPNQDGFDPNVVDQVISIADYWQSPGLINSERELDNNQEALNYIVAKIGTRTNIEMSVLPTPFHSVNWRVASHIVMHPQIFHSEQAVDYDSKDVRQIWWDHGVNCVYITYGTYGGDTPASYPLQAPYSLFPGDKIMANYTVPLWAPTSTGWVACKPITGGSMQLTPQQFPYTGPYGLPTSTFKSKGPTAEAVKRAMGHLGYMPWRDYDQHWNLVLWEAFADWKKSVGLPHDGSYGPKAWEKLRAAIYVRDGRRKFALDPYARYLVQNEAGQNAQGDAEAKVQSALTEFGYTAIRNTARIHYSQNRPIDVSVDPASEFRSDCSGIVIQAYHYAKRKTDLDVPDPAKQNYTGYGNTDWYEDDHPKVGGPYRVGDLAHFHSPRHVAMCIKPGSYKDAEWLNHGQESDPSLMNLSKYSRYPSEFMFVVRPPLLQEDDL
jgi:hypothetical protein